MMEVMGDDKAVDPVMEGFNSAAGIRNGQRR